MPQAVITERSLRSLPHKRDRLEQALLCADQLDKASQKKLAEVVGLIGDSLRNIEQSLLRDKAHVGLFPCYQKIEGLSYKKMFGETIFLCCSDSHLFSPARPGYHRGKTGRGRGRASRYRY